MSYYAKIKGDIHLNGNLSEISEILDQYPGKENGISYNAIRAGFGKQPITIGVDDYTNYDEDAFIEFLNELNPYTRSGEIRCTGEDDELWRFVFVNGRWEEQDGALSFEEENPAVPQQYAVTFVYPDENVTYLFSDWKEAADFVHDNLSLMKEECDKAGTAYAIGEAVVAGEYANFKFASEQTTLIHIAKVHC